MRGGGSATASGMNYQFRVAAWFAVQILADKAKTFSPDFPPDTTYEWLRCETEQPVDDISVGTSDGGHIFVQAKRFVSLSASDNAGYGHALDQFTRQFIASRGRTSGNRSWDRPLDPKKDRLAIFTPSTSSKNLYLPLLNILNRVRTFEIKDSHEELAKSSDERNVLSVTIKLITRSWNAALGSDPTEREIRSLLTQIWIQTLDVEEGQIHESEAVNLLKNVILKNPADAQHAWNKLINLCAELSAKKSGSDKVHLQRTMLSSGINLIGTKSFQNDIDKLKSTSHNTLKSLANLANIQISTDNIKIERKSSIALREEVEKDSILVVGEPGSGKSGSLYELVETLVRQNRDVVFLAVDHLGESSSLGDLRVELGLEHNLFDILENWPGLEPAFLVIDALDAARGEPASRMIRELIRLVVESKGRWRVVASIRKFDLRYGTRVAQLFKGLPHGEYVDKEFKNIRHINIPILSPEELEQALAQSTELKRLVSNSPSKFRELMFVPFNLRLMASLLERGISHDALTPIKSQLDLLDQFWLFRVIEEDDLGDEREKVLADICDEMIRTRTLRTNRTDFSRNGAALNKLLSNQVLSEWVSSPNSQPDRATLAFSHHLLFDYAASRLFRGLPTALLEKITKEPDLAIVARPSLYLHFKHLWMKDDSRTEFWELVIGIFEAENISTITQLVGPSVAVDLVISLNDVEVLLENLTNKSSKRQEAASKAVRHLLGALLASPDVELLLFRNIDNPWSQILEAISKQILGDSGLNDDRKYDLALTIRPSLCKISEQSDRLESSLLAALGLASRRLMEYAWCRTERDGWLFVHALQCVCRTFKSDDVSSANLIRRTLVREHIVRYGYEEMQWLSREIKSLIPYDINLVQEIYIAAFSFKETSDQIVPMGSGQILSLLSNRKQDYDMALYTLNEEFPLLLRANLNAAFRVLISILNSYVEHRKEEVPSRGEESTFNILGQKARIYTDYSHIWSQGTYDRKPLEMLNAFEGYVEELLNSDNQPEILPNILTIAIEQNYLAIIWSRLLRIGCKIPTSLAITLLPLVQVEEILTCMDTTTSAGNFLKVIFPVASISDRELIEKLILALPRSESSLSEEAYKHLRNRLLGCLNPSHLVTQEAKDLRKSLGSSDAIPDNRPPVSFESYTSDYTEVDFLKDQGVPVEEEPNRSIRAMAAPVRAFADKFSNSEPSLSEVKDVFPFIERLFDALKTATENGVHSEQENYTWSCLAAASSRIAISEQSIANEAFASTIKEILLSASRCDKPVPNPEYDAQFDEHPSWTTPAPRLEAARGLVFLIRNLKKKDPEIAKSLERLIQDTVPGVRYQIATTVNVLVVYAEDLMWSLISQIVENEKSNGVLQGLVGGPFNRLAPRAVDKISKLAIQIFDRIVAGPGASKVREYCVGLLTGLYIWRDNVAAGEVVQRIANDPGSHEEEASHLISQFRDALTYGPLDPPDPEKDAVRFRSLNLFKQILESTCSFVQSTQKKYENISTDKWSDTDQQKIKKVLRLIDQLGREMYFISGAFEWKHNFSDEKPPLEKALANRLYREADASFDLLAEIGIPSLAHNLVCTLSYFTDLDPEGVFLRIGKVVKSGKQGGYQYESMAVEKIVQIVEQYLADYRYILRENDQCRNTLLEVLDTFVKVGWPSAQRLTYRLEEIDR